MTQPTRDPTQPIPAAATSEQPAVGTPATSPAWANAAHEGDGAASARPVPVAGDGAGRRRTGRRAPAAVAPRQEVLALAGQRRPRARGRRPRRRPGPGCGRRRGRTWAATHDDTTGTTADGNGRFDRDGDGTFGPPGGRGGMPPGGRLPQQQDGTGGTTGQLPGGGASGQLPGGSVPAPTRTARPRPPEQPPRAPAPTVVRSRQARPYSRDDRHDGSGGVAGWVPPLRDRGGW